MVHETSQIMARLEKWVAGCGNGHFSPEGYDTVGDFGNYSIPDIPGIQQVRGEIEEFISLLLAKGLTGSMLEIGLGHYGSTHFLWRLFIDRVITVEISHSRIREFGARMRQFHGEWVLGDNRSSFLIGSSNSAATVKKAYGLLRSQPVDVLFIDGDHSYEGVLADWLLYSPQVKPDGIVAFHDALLDSRDGGVAEFLEHLENGLVDGRKRALNTIVHSKVTGIAYYHKEA